MRLGVRVLGLEFGFWGWRVPAEPHGEQASEAGSEICLKWRVVLHWSHHHFDNGLIWSKFCRAREFLNFQCLDFPEKGLQ